MYGSMVASLHACLYVGCIYACIFMYTLSYNHQHLGANADGGAWPHPPFASTFWGHSWKAARQGLVHLKLFTTGLIDLPKPRPPRSSHRPPPPRGVSYRDNLVGRIILGEASQVAIQPELAIPDCAGNRLVELVVSPTVPHDPAQGPITKGIKTRLQGTG